MKRKPTLLLLTWLGAAVRWRGLFANTFHADEALFASWGRLIGLWRDPLLETVGVVDKPPLLFYMQGLFFPLVGQVEWAARLPNFVAGLVLVPLTAVLAYQLTADHHTSLLAGALIALSPLAIQFTATAFTDPLMTTLVVAGLVAAVGKRPSWAGWWLGLAVATKYQALLFVPLALVLWWGRGAGEPRSRGAEETYDSLLTTHFLPFTFYFLLPISLALAWDYGRTGSLSLWQAQMASYGGVRLAWSWELWPRLLAWGQLSWLVLGWGWLLVMGYWLFPIPQSPFRNPQIPFLLTYFLLHWLLAIPVWDRYLLPIVPLAAVWAAGGAAELAQSLPKGKQGDRGAGEKERKRGRALGFLTTHYSLRLTRFLFLTFYVLLLSSAYPAWLGRWPIGGQPTADKGAAQLAQALADAPYGTVLYDHWYSWHWRYHFIDTGVYVSWFPHPVGLVEEVAVFGTDGRYLILPVDGRAIPVLRTLHEANIATQPIAAAGEMVLYQLWGMGDGGRRTEDGGRRMEDGGRRMEDGGWKMGDGGWKMEDGRWRMNGRGQRRKDERVVYAVVAGGANGCFFSPACLHQSHFGAGGYLPLLLPLLASGARGVVGWPYSLLEPQHFYGRALVGQQPDGFLLSVQLAVVGAVACPLRR